VLFGVVLLGGGAYAAWVFQQARIQATQLPKGVQSGKAERGDLDETITATGVVAAQVGAKVNVGAEISGRITSLPVDVGKQVHAGQIVATIYAQDLEAQAEQQRQNVMVAQANLLQAESRLRQAQLTAGIAGAQTSAQIDESDSSLRAAKARLQQAQAAAKFQPTQTTSEITRAEAALSTAKSNERQVKQTVELQLLQAKTSIDESRASMENWQRTLNRQQSLLQQGFIARQEVDDSRTALKQARARWESAEAAQRITKAKP
jgi:multidrug efflux pump subunit AcrA (membrane-fusion protein)